MSPDDPRLSYIPLYALTEPPAGDITCLKNHWWVVHPERGALIFQRSAPQANTNQSLAEYLAAKYYPWANVVQVPVSFFRRGT